MNEELFGWGVLFFLYLVYLLLKLILFKWYVLMICFNWVVKVFVFL